CRPPKNRLVHASSELCKRRQHPSTWAVRFTPPRCIVNTSATGSVLAERAQMRARVDAANEAILALRTLIANQRRRITHEHGGRGIGSMHRSKVRGSCLRVGASVIKGGIRRPRLNCD